MNSENPIISIVKRQKAGEHAGLFSCCSANEYVIRAVYRRCKEKGIPALIEATANQVNQFGGYTGQTPEAFSLWCRELARIEGFDEASLILGGDHLGPLTWTKLCESEAMAMADELIKAYVKAGFTKIHIDTSMRLSSDDERVALSDEVIAVRGARLCAAAEESYTERKKVIPDAEPPIYVIGSEVPIPGGSQETESLEVTSSESLRATIAAFRQAFEEKGLAGAWDRVSAVVVQPGVEFSEDDIFVYDRTKAKDLCMTIREYPGLVFEGHSTDYQPRRALREMVSDGIAILKVGPAFTFALREALFALESIEKIIYQGQKEIRSNFSEVLEEAMLKNPVYWEKHYHGDEIKQRTNRAYGLSDRARYYLPDPLVSGAIARLIRNLKEPVPPALLSQFMPIQYFRVREGCLKNSAEDLIMDRIGDYIEDYIFAVEEIKEKTNKGDIECI